MKNLIIRTALVTNPKPDVFYDSLQNTISEIQHDETIDDIEVIYQSSVNYYSALIIGRRKAYNL